MYSPARKDTFKKKYRKLLKKDNARRERLEEKMAEVLQNPYAYKPLRNIMHGLRAVHLDPFVLTFSIDENTKTVWFEDYDHHDKIYRN
jgi:YafQ family addiction module toxin component